MALVFRVVGWVLFLVGAALIIISGGGFTKSENLLPWIGLFIALGGMILTSLSNLISQFLRMRRLRKSPDSDL